MIKYIDKNKIDKNAYRLNIKYETINTILKATYNVKKETYGMVNITGLLAIPFSCMRNIDCSTSEFIEPIYLTLPRTEGKVTITDNIAIERIFFSESLKIKKDSMVITSEELSLLHNGGKPLKYTSSLINDVDSNYLPTTKKAESQKSENCKIEFIRGLITIMYGTEVAKKPRPHLDANGKIKVAFEKIGLKSPCGFTVETWLE